MSGRPLPHPTAQFRVAPAGDPRARSAPRHDRDSVRHARRISDRRVGIRGRADAALGRGLVLPAACLAGPVLVASAHFAGLSRRAALSQSPQIESNRRPARNAVACGARELGTPALNLTRRQEVEIGARLHRAPHRAAEALQLRRGAVPGGLVWRCFARPSALRLAKMQGAGMAGTLRITANTASLATLRAKMLI